MMKQLSFASLNLTGKEWTKMIFGGPSSPFPSEKKKKEKKPVNHSSSKLKTSRDNLIPFSISGKLTRKENSRKNNRFKFLKFNSHFCRQLEHLKTQNAALQKRGFPNLKGILFLASGLCSPQNPTRKPDPAESTPIQQLKNIAIKIDLLVSYHSSNETFG